MRAVILSAGRGTRLRPLTDDRPKCLLPVRGDDPVLEVQLQSLAACGIDEAIVLTGFRADQVEAHVSRRRADGVHVTTVFNPFYAVSDNLATCWLARNFMEDDFLVLNGDTLFEVAVLQRLLASSPSPLTLVVNEKDEYDDDDMKVSLGPERRLVAVGKTLDARIVDGESIGLMRFRDEGARHFRRVIERAIRGEDAISRWYVSVVNEMAQETPVSTLAITGLWWGELDSPEDYASLRAHYAGDGEDDEKREARAHRALFDG